MLFMQYSFRTNFLFSLLYSLLFYSTQAHGGYHEVKSERAEQIEADMVRNYDDYAQNKSPHPDYHTIEQNAGNYPGDNPLPGNSVMESWRHGISNETKGGLNIPESGAEGLLALSILPFYLPQSLVTQARDIDVEAEFLIAEYVAREYLSSLPNGPPEPDAEALRREEPVRRTLKEEEGKENERTTPGDLLLNSFYKAASMKVPTKFSGNIDRSSSKKIKPKFPDLISTVAHIDSHGRKLAYGDAFDTMVNGAVKLATVPITVASTTAQAVKTTAMKTGEVVVNHVDGSAVTKAITIPANAFVGLSSKIFNVGVRLVTPGVEVGVFRDDQEEDSFRSSTTQELNESSRRHLRDEPLAVLGLVDVGLRSLRDEPKSSLSSIAASSVSSLVYRGAKVVTNGSMRVSEIHKDSLNERGRAAVDRLERDQKKRFGLVSSSTAFISNMQVAETYALLGQVDQNLKKIEYSSDSFDIDLNSVLSVHDNETNRTSRTLIRMTRNLRVLKLRHLLKIRKLLKMVPLRMKLNGFATLGAIAQGFRKFQSPNSSSMMPINSIIFMGLTAARTLPIEQLTNEGQTIMNQVNPSIKLAFVDEETGSFDPRMIGNLIEIFTSSAAENGILLQTQKFQIDGDFATIINDYYLETDENEDLERPNLRKLKKSTIEKVLKKKKLSKKLKVLLRAKQSLNILSPMVKLSPYGTIGILDSGLNEFKRSEDLTSESNESISTFELIALGNKQVRDQSLSLKNLEDNGSRAFKSLDPLIQEAYGVNKVAETIEDVDISVLGLLMANLAEEVTSDTTINTLIGTPEDYEHESSFEYRKRRLIEEQQTSTLNTDLNDSPSTMTLWSEEDVSNLETLAILKELGVAEVGLENLDNVNSSNYPDNFDYEELIKLGIEYYKIESYKNHDSTTIETNADKNHEIMIHLGAMAVESIDAEALEKMGFVDMLMLQEDLNELTRILNEVTPTLIKNQKNTKNISSLSKVFITASSFVDIDEFDNDGRRRTLFVDIDDANSERRLLGSPSSSVIHKLDYSEFNTMGNQYRNNYIAYIGLADLANEAVHQYPRFAGKVSVSALEDVLLLGYGARGTLSPNQVMDRGFDALMKFDIVTLSQMGIKDTNMKSIEDPLTDVRLETIVKYIGPSFMSSSMNKKNPPSTLAERISMSLEKIESRRNLSVESNESNRMRNTKRIKSFQKALRTEADSVGLQDLSDSYLSTGAFAILGLQNADKYVKYQEINDVPELVEIGQDAYLQDNGLSDEELARLIVYSMQFMMKAAVNQAQNGILTNLARQAARANGVTNPLQGTGGLGGIGGFPGGSLGGSGGQGGQGEMADAFIRTMTSDQTTEIMIQAIVRMIKAYNQTALSQMTMEDVIRNMQQIMNPDDSPAFEYDNLNNN